MNYKIVADSAANLYELGAVPFAFVPLSVCCEDKEFIDVPELDLEEMLSTLRQTKQKSSSSCPNMADWLEAFGEAEEVYAVAITGGLSGSFNAAMQAKEEYQSLHPDSKVHVIDSLSAGPEMALMVERLAALKAAGCTFEETVAGITAYIQKTRLAFCLESVQNFANNGRIKPTVAKLVGALGIRIVGRASAEGTLQQEHLCRGAAKGLQMLMQEMKNCGFCGGKVRIHHCRNLKAAEALRNELLKINSYCDIEIRPCGGLCSFYAEEGGLLIGYET
jgi:DegV family protein with EDD domain